MRFPLRRVLLGFAAGAAAGWVISLLRTPTNPPEGSSADEATKLPQEEFGHPVDLADEPLAPAEPVEEATHEHPPPKKATAPAVRRPPGSKKTAAKAGDGESEPAKPARRAKKAAPDPHVEAAATLREAHAEAAERLAAAEADATPPQPDPGPARRRRRVTPPGG